MDVRLLPQQQLKVTPKQIAANYILQLSSMELQDVINQELDENPALELEETPTCPLCGGELSGRVCLRCFGTGTKGGNTSYASDSEPLEGTNLMVRDDDEEEFDPIARAEAEMTLGEYLSWHVRVLLPKRLQPAAELIIGDLNDAGYLVEDLNEIAREAHVTAAEAEHQVIVECQRDFLEKGIQHLRPLTRAEVGERIGMHESTVSRATAGKFVLLPSGQVVPFSLFFTASLGVKDVIKNIISAEDLERPYSDQEFVEKLREDNGIRPARRTVAKYREELQILPARLRKRG